MKTIVRRRIAAHRRTWWHATEGKKSAVDSGDEAHKGDSPEDMKNVDQKTSLDSGPN